MLSVEYFAHTLRFLRQWIKHPYWSITCCQTLLLPVNDLEEDTGDLIDGDVLKNQMQMEDGNLKMASVHDGAKDNEGLEVIDEENEIDETKMKPDKIYREQTAKKYRVNELDLGVGSGISEANVGSSEHAGNKAEDRVQEVDVGVHGVGEIEDEAKEEVKVETFDQGAQTELSLLEEMDDEAIEQMGFAHDESL